MWSQLGERLVGTGAEGYAMQGYSVGLSGDAQTAIVGGIADNSAVGASWIFTLSGSAVEDPTSRVPRSVRLEQNYPNPFNPSTTIRYAVPRSSRVELAVFNALGRCPNTRARSGSVSGVFATQDCRA